VLTLIAFQALMVTIRLTRAAIFSWLNWHCAEAHGLRPVALARLCAALAGHQSV
jgi:hypothetical protein